MKRLLFIVIALGLLWPTALLAEGPKRIMGLELGGDISNFQELVRPDSAMPVRHMEYVTEVEMSEQPGLKSGMVYYGNCAAPGKIVWIKIKYLDYSRDFYDELLKRFKDRFGEPDKWRGDPFQVVIAWKWQFNTDDKDQISMILQHNTKDHEEKMGNVLKLKLSRALEKEMKCFVQKNPEEAIPERKPLKDPDWDRLIPY